MPHSSGGGSHRGGSHHSHSSHRSHSSHSSHSSGHGGYASAPIRFRRSNLYFPGARTFVYYTNLNEQKEAHYVYSSEDLTKLKEKSPLRVFLRNFFNSVFIFYLLTAFVLLGIYVMNKEDTPNRLSGTDNYEIIVSDQAGILQDTTQLTEALNEFQDTTGIVPAFYTVHNEDWQSNYDDLESYAYDLYVNTFADEDHWLIVYSQPITPDAQFDDWYWEGMQGDDTDDILTYEKADAFDAKMQKYLTQRSQYSIEEAVTKSFNETTPTIMENSSNDSEMKIVYYYVVQFLLFVTIIGLIRALIKQNRLRDEFNKPYKYADLREVKDAVDGQPKIGKCEYCSGNYRIGVDMKCPNCGAPLPY